MGRRGRPGASGWHRSPLGWGLVINLATSIVCFPAQAIPPIAPIAPQVATPTGDPDRAQFEQARQDYGAGRLAAAAAGWRQVADRAAARGDRAAQAAALNGLSLALGLLGDRAAAMRAINQSLGLLTVDAPWADRLRAAALNQRARLELAAGQASQAVQTLEQAERLYQSVGDREGATGAALNQAQALQALGLYGRALAAIESQVVSWQGSTGNPRGAAAPPDARLEGLGLLAAGEALRDLGQLERSREVLGRAAALVAVTGDRRDQSAVALAIARTQALIARQAADRTDRDDPQRLGLQREAIAAFDRAIAAAQTAGEVRDRLWAQLERWDLTAALTTESSPDRPALEAIARLVEQLPAGRDRVAARMRLARGWLALAQPEPAIAALTTAAQEANGLGDRRLEAAAWGKLGDLDREQGNGTRAARRLDRSLALVEGLAAPEVTYRTARSLGQLRNQQGNRTGALAAYRTATAAIGQLRNDLAGLDSVVQFSLRDRVEPVYREFVDQLLRGNPSQEDLQAARSAIEALQLVELENFFRQACLDARPEPLDRAIDARTDTAAIEAIILPDRVATLVKLPGQPLRYATAAVPKPTVLDTLQRLQQAVQDPSVPGRDRLRLSQQTYQWLVAPVAADLDRAGVTTLVFVLDGPLANIPIAALHDGNRYLLERYNTTRALGLQLFAPKTLDPRSLAVLAAGVSESAPSFEAENLEALPFVADELEILTQALPTALLRDRDLTETAFRQALQNTDVPIVHIATHAQFSSRADRTFLLAWDRRIALADFDRLLRRPARRSPIELLVLSACETARGDDRATLGLTGIAIQAGTRSVLGTLWQVSDESTALLMGDFYQNLRAGATKAEALRRAQLALLADPNFRHPFYWAPYILVGNWL